MIDVEIIGNTLAVFGDDSGETGPIDFRPFPKIPRLKRQCVITEKIDGTNAVIYVHPSGAVLAGSRTRWITPDRDNFGFAAWVKLHEDELRQLGAGWHYGEWYGSGIQRGYGLKDRRFALFNAGRWHSVGNSERWGISGQLTPACCEVVPVLYAGPFSDEANSHAITVLSSLGSVAVPGFANPEGIVIFHEASGQVFKVLCENDVQPKGDR